MKHSLLIVALMTVIVAIILFVYGMKINKRRVIVIKAKYTILVNFLAILWLTIVVFSIQELKHNYRWSVGSFIVIGIIVMLGVIFFIFSPNNLNVINASKDDIYNILESILLKHGVNYEWKKSKIFISESKLFIRIWYRKASKTCTLALSNIKFPEIIGNVFEDFINQLNNQKSDFKSLLGITFIFLSVVSMILGILIFVLWLLI